MRDALPAYVHSSSALVRAHHAAFEAVPVRVRIAAAFVAAVVSQGVPWSSVACGLREHRATGRPVNCRPLNTGGAEAREAFEATLRRIAGSDTEALAFVAAVERKADGKASPEARFLGAAKAPFFLQCAGYADPTGPRVCMDARLLRDKREGRPVPATFEASWIQWSREDGEDAAVRTHLDVMAACLDIAAAAAAAR